MWTVEYLPPLPPSPPTELNPWSVWERKRPFPCRIAAMAKLTKRKRKIPVTHFPPPAACKVYSSPSSLAGKASLNRLLSWRLELAVMRGRWIPSLKCGGTLLSVVFVSTRVGPLPVDILNSPTLFLRKHTSIPWFPVDKYYIFPPSPSSLSLLTSAEGCVDLWFNSLWCALLL